MEDKHAYSNSSELLHVLQKPEEREDGAVLMADMIADRSDFWRLGYVFFLVDFISQVKRITAKYAKWSWR